MFQFLILFLVTCFLIGQETKAAPIDVHGNFSSEYVMIENNRKLDQKNQNITNQGSQENALASGNQSTASFQDYIFTLNPHIIVNDSTTLKGEISSGYARGGLFGENTTQTKKGNMANALYYYNTTDGQNSLVLNKFYAEFYADTATYLVGRHTDHWGLGVLYNSGEKSWDRHFYSRDGLTAKIKLGNFAISPFFGRAGAEASLTRATRTKEYGASLLYDNTEREVGFGLLYAKKENGGFNSTMNADITPDNVNNPISMGKAEIKIVDLYFKKTFGIFSIAGEIPLMNGEIGHLYNASTESKYKGKAFIFESDLKLGSTWSAKLDAGQVSGHSGSESSFDALYLNPNYQIANILFRYNIAAIADPTQSVFDSYIVNARYAKVAVGYGTDKWTWNSSLIYAKALQTAKAGSKAFNHTNNKLFNANTTQSSDLGFEVDSNIDYSWNKEVIFGFAFGYHFVGDYYAFSNDTARILKTKNSMLISLKASVNF